MNGGCVVGDEIVFIEWTVLAVAATGARVGSIPELAWGN